MEKLLPSLSNYLSHIRMVHPSDLHLSDVTEVTYRNELKRAISSGILETAAATFLLLIAVKHFDAGPTEKALIAAGGSFGMLLAPLVVRYASRYGATPTGAASALLALSGLALLITGLYPTTVTFVALVVVALASSTSAVPLLTQMYKENYPEARRGQLYSRSVSIRILTMALFSEAAGRLLSYDLAYYQHLLLLFSFCAFAGSYSVFKIPTKPLSLETKRWFAGFRGVWGDRMFRSTLISWMFMGFGNLMMVPMRIEYLANPRYGLSLTVAEVALFTGVIPNLVRFLLSPVWGALFDRMNFFKLRITLNAGFMLGILTFFTAEDTSGMVLGSILFGASTAGGDIAWNLWVTKFAPPGKTADYMAVHSCLTGVRGVLAPIFAFWGVQHLALGTLASIAAAFILIACLLLGNEVRLGTGRARGER